MVPARLLLLFAVRGAAGFLADLALAKIRQDGLLALRRDMFARLLDARLALFREQNATALSNTVVFEVQNGATLLVNAVTGLLKDSVALVALLAYLLYLNWQLTLIVFLIVPGVAWLMRTVSRRLLPHRPQHARPPPTTWPTSSRKTCWPPAWCACTARSRRRPAASRDSAARCGGWR